jgi:formylglycine-generating enzyme required for sulfatase activity
VDLHKADDLARVGATLMLKKIDDALAKLGPAVEGKSGPSALALDLGKGVTMKLVRIRPGRFLMGSPDSEQGRDHIEGPQHEVTISKPFYLGVTEVTQAEYEAVMGAKPSTNKAPTNPVEQVSWNEATEFCRRLSAKAGNTVRLPTEAEWEYACRAGSRTRFCCGDSESALAEYAWFIENSPTQTHAVGQRKPNAWGLYDMHGNLWEWCQDYGDSYAARAVTDPTGPASGSSCVLRGGSWGRRPQECRSATRRWEPPDLRRGNFGFRVVVDLK